MTEILPIFLSSCILAWFSHIFSKYDEQTLRYVKRDKIIYAVMCMFLILFAGLRTRYNDTSNYIESYIDVIDKSKSIWNEVDFAALGSNPGFLLARNIIKHLGFSTQSFILFFSVITLTIYLWFINKYSSNIALSIYLMFTVGVYVFTLAAIKQCLAIGFGLIAIDRFLNNKKFWFMVFILIGATFHPYVLMFLITPILTFKPWTKKTYYMIGIFAVLGITFQHLVGRVVNVTSILGEEYTVDTFSGAGVNPFRTAVCLVPVILSFVVRRNVYDENYDKQNNLILNLTFLNGLIMFLALFGTANYFGRLAHYFLIFSVISIPWLLKHLNTRYRPVIIFLAIMLYFLYFCYESIYGGAVKFDDAYDRVTLGYYLESLSI